MSQSQPAHSTANERVSVQPRPLALSRHAVAGAMLAVCIAALWILEYLLTTQYGTRLFGTAIWRYVTGLSYGAGEEAVESLFVVLTRFLLVFGLGWGPLMLLVALAGRR